MRTNLIKLQGQIINFEPFFGSFQFHDLIRKFPKLTPTDSLNLMSTPKMTVFRPNDQLLTPKLEQN